MKSTIFDKEICKEMISRFFFVKMELRKLALAIEKKIVKSTDSVLDYFHDFFFFFQMTEKFFFFQTVTVFNQNSVILAF